MAASEYTAVLRLLHHLTDLVMRLRGEVDSLTPADCFLSKRQAAEFLACSLRTLDKHLHEIPRYRVHGRVLFKRSELNEYLKNFRIEPSPSEAIRLQELAQKSLAKLHEA